MNTAIAVVSAAQAGLATGIVGTLWWAADRDWSVDLRSRIVGPVVGGSAAAAVFAWNLTDTWLPALWGVLGVGAAVMVGLPVKRAVQWRMVWRAIRTRSLRV